MPTTQIHQQTLLGGRYDELTSAFSSPETILNRLEDALGDAAPRGFGHRATPREPRDYVVIRSTVDWIQGGSHTTEMELTDAEFSGRTFQQQRETIPVTELVDVLDAGISVLVNQERSECSACGGRATCSCTRCDGDVLYDCPDCEGSGRQPCGACRGEETVPCGTCGGNQRISCPDCRGDSPPCERCNGNGELRKNHSCPDCTGGTVTTEETCEKCQGTGCSACQTLFSLGGTKEVTKVCESCSGSGGQTRIITCPSCRGTQTQSCETCAEEGTVTCDDCGGVGHEPCTECTNGEVECSGCGGLQMLECRTCDDGRVACATCAGEEQTHKLTVERTTFTAETVTVEERAVPAGVDDPLWIELPEAVYRFDDRPVFPPVRAVDDIVLDDVAQADTYARIETLCLPVRKLMYDYGDDNFAVQEVHQELYYTRHPTA